MKKIIYTRIDGGVSVVIPAPKAQLEKVLGPLTEYRYKKHVEDRSIPVNAINVRYVNDSDIPTSREFRGAWVDSSSESKIDICCEKAKEVGLKRLREVRNVKLAKTDIDMTRALESNDAAVINTLKVERQALRNSTEVLKNINTIDKINDESILQQISQLSKELD